MNPNNDAALAKIEELRAGLMNKTKEMLKSGFDKGVEVSRALGAVEGYYSAFNALYEQVLEWNSLYFPELANLVSDPEKYLNIVLIGLREKLELREAEKFLGKEKAEIVVREAGKSLGVKEGKEELERIAGIASQALELKEKRKELQEYVEREVKEIAPNTSVLCGGMLCARLLAQAGSLKRLAMLPSSTIQLLGAEKALFKHLRSGVKPPKHGLILQHPLVRELKPWQRGKMARSLAGKIAIAARGDYFGDKSLGEKLLGEAEERHREIKELKEPSPKARTAKSKPDSSRRPKK